MPVSAAAARPMRRLCALAAPVFGLALAWPGAAHADHEIFFPYAEEGEWELEDHGSASFDRNPTKRGEANASVAIGYGLASWYRAEIELGYGRDAGPSQPIIYQGIAWESFLQFTERGERWADLGFFVQVTHAGPRATPDNVLFGPLVSKDVGHTTHTLNLFLTQEFGPAQEIHSLDFSYGWQSRWNLTPLVSPAVEIFGDAGPLNHVPRLGGQQLLAGPTLVGKVGFGGVGALRYDVGYLAGLTAASPRYTVKWDLEWELPF